MASFDRVTLGYLSNLPKITSSTSTALHCRYHMHHQLMDINFIDVTIDCGFEFMFNKQYNVQYGQHPSINSH